MLEFFEAQKIASIMTAAEDDMTAGRIIAEGSKRFFDLMIGPLLAVTDVNNTK